MNRCFECKHIDFKEASENKMKYWGLCKLASNEEDQSRYRGRISTCNKGKAFSKVTEEQIKGRIQWLEKGNINNDL